MHTHRSSSHACSTCFGSLSSAVASASFTALQRFNCFVSVAARRSCWGPSEGRSEAEEASSGWAVAAWDSEGAEADHEEAEEQARCRASPTALRILRATLTTSKASEQEG